MFKFCVVLDYIHT